MSWLGNGIPQFSAPNETAACFISPLLLSLLHDGMEKRNGGTKGVAYKLGKETFTRNNNRIRKMKNNSNHINNTRVQEKGERFVCKMPRIGFSQLIPLPCLLSWKTPLLPGRDSLAPGSVMRWYGITSRS